MMSDQNIELLELYLDGELAPDEIAALERRLAAESDLAVELKRLEAGRAQRMQLWKSYEAAEPAVPERILGALHAKQSRWAWFMRIMDHREHIAAAAACIAVFLIGWQWGRNIDAYRMVQSGGSAARPVSLIEQQQIPVGPNTMFEVRLSDASGKVVRVERFATLRDAQRFVEDMRQQLQK